MYHHKKSYISSKPASRLARRRPPSQFWSNAKKFIITYKNILLALVIVFLAATILNLAYNYTIGKPENTVTEVVFSEDARLIYNEPGLYSLIEKEVKWRNIPMLRLKNTGKVRKAIQEAYPIVKDISFQKVSANTVSASLSFNSVDLLFTNEAVTIGYGNKRLFTVHQGDTIASGALTIRLPDYFSGDKIQAYTTGYVLLASPEKLKGDYHLIADALPIDDIFFVAGSQKSIISSANKSIVFDHKRSIAAQLEYLKTVARTLSGDVVYEIDLATYPTVIIRKN